MKKILVLLVAGILLNGCVAKKVVTEYKETVKLDSIYIVKDRFITERVLDTLTIKEPCDSITGKLRDFEKEINVTNAKVVLKSVQGEIKVEVDIDSIVNSRITEFKQTFKNKIEYKKTETEKYRIPFWVWITILVEGLIIFLLIRFK